MTNKYYLCHSIAMRYETRTSKCKKFMCQTFQVIVFRIFVQHILVGHLPTEYVWYAKLTMNYKSNSYKRILNSPNKYITEHDTLTKEDKFSLSSSSVDT